MKTTMAIVLAAALAACSGTKKESTMPDKTAPAKGLQIKLTSIYVDDQDKALAFYTGVLGFEKKDDVENGGYRWLTVTAPGAPDGGQLQLAKNDNPAGKAYQQALYTQHQPAVMFYTSDIKADAARIEANGAKLTMPVTSVPGAQIAQFEDTVGNLVQISQIMH